MAGNAQREPCAFQSAGTQLSPQVWGVVAYYVRGSLQYDMLIDKTCLYLNVGNYSGNYK